MELYIEPHYKKADEIRKIHRYAVICALLWTALLVGLFISYFVDSRHDGQVLQEAFIQTIIWLFGIGFILIGNRKIVNTLILLRDERNKLRDSEESYRRQFAENTAIMLLIDPADGRVIDANSAALAFYGYSCEQLLRMNLNEITVLSTPEVTRDLDSVTFENGAQFECQHRMADGSIRDVEESSSRIRFGHRQILHLIIFDITEQMRAEKALGENRNQLKDIIEFLPDATLAINKEKRVIIWNRAIEEMTGFSAEEMMGKGGYAYTIPFYGEARSQLMDLVFVDSKETAALYPNITREGDTLIAEVFCKALYNNKGAWVISKASPLHDQSGNIIGAIESIRDITERKQAEEERRQLEQQFHHAQKMESLGVLAGGVAHDFNNILTVILGYCYLAREDGYSEQEFRASFQKIESAANRAADLCQQMLTYSGRTESIRTKLDLLLLVDEDVKMLTSGIGKNVTISLDLDTDVPEIEGDSGQIQQIVMNLIINAAEAIGAENGTIKVSLSKRIIEMDQTEMDAFGEVIHSGIYSCLEVADTGCGMDEETQKRLFEPFYTTKFTGRGLGMSAIRGIVRSHEGALQLSSMPDVGTTFKVLFPLSEASNHASTAVAESAPTEKAGGTVLLVDDEEMMLNMGTSLLKVMGFSVICAQHGREALEIYRDRNLEIDVILLDLVMPVMGGIEAYYELRKIDPEVPIVMCSGYSVESVSDVIDNDQHAGFVHKPYKPEELRGVMTLTK